MLLLWKNLRKKALIQIWKYTCTFKPLLVTEYKGGISRQVFWLALGYRRIPIKDD